MSLRERGGKWHWRYTLDGRPYSGTTDWDATERNARKALDEEAAHRKAIKEGRAPHRPLAARTFSDAAAEFLAWCEVEHRERPSTAQRVAGSFTSLREHFGALMVGQITPGAIERYKVWRVETHEVCDVTIRHDLHALSKFFGWARKMRYAAENPVREVDIPSDENAVRIHVLTAAEERAYFDAVAALESRRRRKREAPPPPRGDQDLHDVGRLLIQQGMRPAEVLALTPADVDVVGATLAVRRGKTKAARRTLTLTSESRSILARRCSGLAPEALIFAVSCSTLAKRHERALEASGVSFVPYDLRHTFATRLAQHGCDLPSLAAILGHSSLRIVQRYVHPTAEHQAAAMRSYDASQQAAARRAEVVQ